jgi:hypothetical protein
MGIPVLVIGESGSGKSSSLRNFKPNEIGIYNVAGKPLPFRGKFQMMMTVSDPDAIRMSLKRNMANCYVIDDSQYLMSFKLIDKINERGYDKYTEIAKNFKDLIDTVVNDTSPDTIVYFLHHTEYRDDGHVKAKTSGKMIDNWLTLEGLFSIVIMAVATENKHLFVTQNDGTSTCKSPMGMLENPMDNDLKVVDTAIREYYELAAIGTTVKKEAKQSNATVSTIDKIPKEG